MAKGNPQLPDGDRRGSQRRGRGFEAASKLVAGHLRAPAEKRGFAEAKLLSRWSEVAGPDLSALCQPVKLRHSRNTKLGNTLVVLTTGANAPILAMRQEELIARVNACYGYRAVSKLQITQTAPTGFAEGQAEFVAKPRAKATLPLDATELAEAEATIAKVENPDLRQALGRLSRNILTRHAEKRGTEQ